jgi:Contractile injection system tube protein/LysM domain
MGTATITQWDLATHRPAQGLGVVSMTVDFDPESIELSYTTLGTVSGKDTTSQGTLSKTAPQQTSQSSTMSLTLLFDTSTTTGSVLDRTDRLVALTLPTKIGSEGPSRPVLCFQWGSFVYTGMIESMTQTIDFFSDSGVPLRASVHLTLSEVVSPKPSSGSPSPGGLGLSFGANAGLSASASLGASAGASASIGTTPLTLSQAGDTIQGIAARSGGAVSWQAIATANGVDNPRLVPAGTIVDAGAGGQLDAGASSRLSANASAGVSGSGSAAASAPASASTGGGG